MLVVYIIMKKFLMISLINKTLGSLPEILNFNNELLIKYLELDYVL